MGISQQTFENFKNTALPQLVQAMNAVTLPDYKSTLGTGFLKVTARMTKVRCSNFNLDVKNTGVTLKAPNQVVVAASGLTGQMTFSWGYMSPLGGDSGDGTVQILSAGLSATLELSQVNGVPLMTVSALNFTITDVGITIANTPIASVANWLLSVVKTSFITDLTTALNQYGPGTLTAVLGEVLGGYSTRIPLSETLAIDYNFTSDPQVVSDSFLQLNILGQFIDLTHPDQVMLVNPPPELPQFDPESSDVQVLVSDFTLNTGLYAGMTSGAFNLEVTQQTPTIGAMLTTSNLDNYFPGLEKTYGEDKPCELSCDPAAPAPYFSLIAGAPGNMTGHSVMDCDLFVIEEEQRNHTLSLKITSAFSVEARLEHWVLKLNLANSKVTNVEIYECNLPKKPSEQSLKNIMNLLVMKGAVPSAFEMVFGKGIELPTFEGVDLSDATLTIMDGYLAIQASPVFTFDSQSPKTR